MKLKNRPAADAAVEALRQQVHGDKLSTCGSCGTRRPCEPDTMHIVEALGKGRVFYRCGDCVVQEQHRLGAHAAAFVLEMDPGDPALRDVRVERFEELPHSDPARPNRTPWAHLNVAALAETVERARREIGRRTGGPCFYCGMPVTPEGTTWLRENNQPVCGACFERFQTTAGDGSTYKDRRSRAAVVLCGLDRGLGTPLLDGLGEQIGVVWWGESGKTTPNEHPFQHLNLTQLRGRARAALHNRTDLLALIDRLQGVTVQW